MSGYGRLKPKDAPRKRALDLLRDNGGSPLDAASVAVLLGGATPSARAVLDQLVRRGEAERINVNGQTLYRARTTKQTAGVEDHAQR